jgi:hypothetical protein
MLGALKQAEAGIQLFLKFRDFRLPPAFGGVARNDYRFAFSAPFASCLVNQPRQATP